MVGDGGSGWIRRFDTDNSRRPAMNVQTSNRMHAIGWPRRGAAVDPVLMDIERPEPGRGQVRVSVRNSALNPADLKVASGGFVGKILHASVSPLVVGYDFSGVIDQCGDAAGDLHVGDAVFGFLPYGRQTRQGAFAESVIVDVGQIARKPDQITHETAAAAATPALTALQGLRDGGRLRPGGRVMIVGASGGVGCLAIGVAKRLDASVTAVCGTHAVEFVRGLGADSVIDRRKEDPLKAPGAFDVVLDTAAAYSYAACRPLLTASGVYVTTLPNAGLIIGKLLTMFSSQGCAMISVQPVRQDFERVASFMSEGMPVPIDARFAVRDLPLAFARLQQGAMRGRVSIQVEGGFG
jgi:alcohol dehydrogenase